MQIKKNIIRNNEVSSNKFLLFILKKNKEKRSISIGMQYKGKDNTKHPAGLFISILIITYNDINIIISKNNNHEYLFFTIIFTFIFFFNLIMVT
jgi:hypothetical protein